MKSKKTQYMTSMALFLAIEIILVVTPLGYIPIGPLNATTMHIPVIIAGIILGKKAGAELGFVFGLTSMIKATIQPGITSFCFSPFVTIGTISGNYKSLLIAFVPRILLGYLAGLIFEIMKNKGHENSRCTGRGTDEYSSCFIGNLCILWKCLCKFFKCCLFRTYWITFRCCYNEWYSRSYLGSSCFIGRL